MHEVKCLYSCADIGKYDIDVNQPRRYYLFPLYTVYINLVVNLKLPLVVFERITNSIRKIFDMPLNHKIFIAIILFIMVSLALVNAKHGIELGGKETLQHSLGSKSKYSVVFYLVLICPLKSKVANLH